MEIRGGANINSISYDDFYAIDPVSGNMVKLTDSYKWSGSTVNGMKVFN